MTCADARPLLSQRLDRELPGADGRRLDEHLRSCRSCQSTWRDLQAEHDLLTQHWTAPAAPAGLAAAVARSLPPRSGPSRPQRLLTLRRPALVGAAAALLLAVAVAVPPVRAGINAVLQSVSLRETTDPPPERRVGQSPVLTLEQAQQRVPWPIRTPDPPPEGYHLAGTLVDEFESFADGPTVALYYLDGEGASAPEIRITQRRMRPGERADLLLEPGASTPVRVDGRDALLVDGEWQERDGGMLWVRGTLLRVVVEDDGLLLTVEADPRDGLDADDLIRVAASLR